jgi:hypothetical protein
VMKKTRRCSAFLDSREKISATNTTPACLDSFVSARFAR